MKRLHVLGVLGLLVGVPYLLASGVDGVSARFSALRPYALRLRSLRPTVSLSMVRNDVGAMGNMAGRLEPLAPASAPATFSAPAPAPRVVIEPLPASPIKVTVQNVNTDETATFAIGRDGRVSPEQAPLVKHFFRCRRSDKEKAIAPGTLALLAEVAQRWPGKTIEIVSGFRAPPFGAPHSKHFAGQAIDLRVRGVRSALVRDFIWRDHHQVGVGHYPAENFVHLDSRPGEADMAWTGEGEDGANSYSPRWAWKARHPGRRDRRTAPLAEASPARHARSL
jgi:uncharacterized protein YcbK (DUF882 family)